MTKQPPVTRGRRFWSLPEHVGNLELALFLVKELEDEAGDGPALERRERFNVALVLFVSQALQTLVVVLAVTGFFVVLGALAIGLPIREAWEVADGSLLLGFDLFGERIEITEALLRVSGGIGAFAGLYYTIAVLTDSTYREEFLDELTDEMRASFVARAEYRAARANLGDASDPSAA